jgi:hypothetical protein
MLRKFSTNLLVGLSGMSNHYKAVRKFSTTSELRVIYNFFLRGGSGNSWAMLLCGGGESWWCSSWAAALNRRVLDDGRRRVLVVLLLGGGTKSTSPGRRAACGALGVRINGRALAPGRPDWSVDYFRWRGICQGVLAKVGLHGGGA